jgi:hypothetical protein
MDWLVRVHDARAVAAMPKALSVEAGSATNGPRF